MLIAIKEKNNVHIAVSAYGAYDEISEADMLHEENLPLWRVDGVPKCLMSAAGIPSLGDDLVRYMDWKRMPALTQANLVTKIIPKMKERLSEFRQLDKGGRSWDGFLIARGGRAFYVLSSFTCEEVEESYAVGRYDAVARGALLLTKGLPPLERIKVACREVERVSKYKQFPVVVMNTATEERTVLYDV